MSCGLSSPVLVFRTGDEDEDEGDEDGRPETRFRGDPDHVAGLADLRALLDLHAWWRKSGYRLDEVAIAFGQTPRYAVAYPDATAIANQVVERRAVLAGWFSFTAMVVLALQMG